MTIKMQTVAVLLPLCLAGAIANGQPMAGKAFLQATQTSEYWIDPTTKLMWAAKDNGKDVSWKGAVKYCHKLSVADLSGWRMPNMDELQRLYDKNVVSPGLMGAAYYHNVSPSTWHVKGNLFLTGDQWTTFRPLDDRGKPSSYAYYFDFNEGRPNDDPTGWPYPYVGRRVLCVRGPEAFPVQAPIQH